MYFFVYCKLSKVGSLNVTKKKDDSAAPFENDTELLLWLVKLFHIDPQIALTVSLLLLLIGLRFLVNYQKRKFFLCFFVLKYLKSIVFF